MSRHFREQNWFVENHVSHGNKHYTMFLNAIIFLEESIGHSLLIVSLTFEQQVVAFGSLIIQSTVNNACFTDR